MIFKKCTCGVDLTPASVMKISMTELGLWMTCIECHSTPIIRMAEVVRRSEEKANGDPFKQLEIDYYKERLSEWQQKKEDQ